jgi:hypothetical protein
MERTRSSPNLPNSNAQRQLSILKVLSRLLGHELHTQQSPRLTLSREEVIEIQTSLDLYIENVMRSKGPASGAVPVADLEVQAVPARVN